MKDNLETVGYGLIGCAIALMILAAVLFWVEVISKIWGMM